MEQAPPEEPPGQHRLSEQFAAWVATGGWLGFFPYAPGTVGAALGLPLAWGIGELPTIWLQAALMAGLVAAGVPLCTLAARGLGGAKDPGAIIYDETATLPITFFLVPLDSPGVVVVGFLLHRVFDISKPPPARSLERLPWGWGIMADDVAAAVYSNIALHVLLLFV